MNDLSIWLMAIRPKTLTASFIPVVVGTALAYREGSVEWILALCCLLCAFSIQIGTNLINDALDFQKGTDTEKRIGPVRVVQRGLLTPEQVLAGGIYFLIMATLFSFPLAINGGFLSGCVLSLSISLAYLYTGGPYPLSYQGLGEVFVFLFFGLIATVGSYFIQTLQFTLPPIIAGAQIGLLATLIIAMNNLRDINTDSEANKRTLPVRFGLNFGKWLITFCAYTPFLLSVYWVTTGALFAGLLPWVTLPIAVKIVRAVWQLYPSNEYNHLFGLCALLHLLFNLSLAVGIFL